MNGELAILSEKRLPKQSKNIDWKKISPQHYQFVYLKATEGGDYQDDKFQQYWLEARERGMRVGAYHFFRLCRDGDIQAQNFII